MGLFNRKRKSPVAEDRTSNQCITFMQFVEYVCKKREYAGFSTTVPLQLAYFSYFACFFRDHLLISESEKSLVYNKHSKTVPLLSSLTQPEAAELLMLYDELYSASVNLEISVADQLRFFVYAAERDSAGPVPDELSDLDESRLNITVEAIVDELILLGDALQ